MDILIDILLDVPEEVLPRGRQSELGVDILRTVTQEFISLNVDIIDNLITARDGTSDMLIDEHLLIRRHFPLPDLIDILNTDDHIAIHTPDGFK